MRKYENAHPWISFHINLREADYRLWMLLGEARSKCEHIAGSPLSQAVYKHLHTVYLAKGALATTAIEGNTLTEEQARQRVEGKLKLPASQEYLGHEIDNIVKAVNQIGSEIIRGDSSNILVGQIKEYNRLVLDGLEVEEGVIPGEIPSHEVVVATYSGAPREDCEYLLQRLCDWLNSNEFTPKDDNAIVMGLIRAILAHIYIAWIHPFGDGNGRTARLVEFQILVAAGVSTPAAHLLSNHYNQTRQEYYRQLDKASRAGGDVLPFMEYALRGFVDGLRDQLNVIRQQQLFIIWRDYVFSQFKDKTSVTDKRRRDLVLDLSAQTEPIQSGKMSEITPGVAKAYASKKHKTLTRDLNELIKMRLIKKSPEGYSANIELVYAFLPLRRAIEERPQ